MKQIIYITLSGICGGIITGGGYAITDSLWSLVVTVPLAAALGIFVGLKTGRSRTI